MDVAMSSCLPIVSTVPAFKSYLTSIGVIIQYKIRSFHEKVINLLYSYNAKASHFKNVG